VNAKQNKQESGLRGDKKMGSSAGGTQYLHQYLRSSDCKINICVMNGLIIYRAGDRKMS
jgi:hypothetical protein